MNFIRNGLRYLFLVPLLFFVLFSAELYGQVEHPGLKKKMKQLISSGLLTKEAGVTALKICDAGVGDQPDIAVDSKGNVHIASSRYKSFTCNYRNYTGTNEYIIIQWNTFHRTNGKPAIFQAVLYKSGKIMLSIKDNSGAVDEFPITGVNKNEFFGTDLDTNPPASLTTWKFTLEQGASYTVKQLSAPFWIDVYNKGEQKPVWVEEDDCSAIVPIGFMFDFYNEQFEYCAVSSNGYISFYNAVADDYSNPLYFPSPDTSAFKVIAPLWDDWNPELKPVHMKEIYYSMINGSTGALMIAPTLISRWDGIESTRPAIEVDEEDKVHVVWRDEMWDDHQSAEITYTKLDPYKDDRDGTTAVEKDITLEDDTRLTNLGEGWATTPRLKIDKKGYIHIVWENTYEGIYYMRISDDSTTPFIPPTIIREIPDAFMTSIDIAVDDNSNAHIIWSDRKNTMNYEIYYAMIDGNYYSRKIHMLIDATLITEDDNDAGFFPTIEVDDQGHAYLFWLEQLEDENFGYEENYVSFTIIDPYSDDQDGGPASLEAITAIPINNESVLGNIATISSDIDADNFVHLIWWNQDYLELGHSIYNVDGFVSEEEFEAEMLVTTPSEWMKPYCAVDNSEKLHFVWFDLLLRGVAYANTDISMYGKPESQLLLEETAPEKTTLLQNYPNPFNPSTKISYYLKEAGTVKIEIYDVTGRRLKMFDIGSKPSGTYEITWDGRTENGIAAAGGIYFCKLRSAGMIDIKKMILMK